MAQEASYKILKSVPIPSKRGGCAYPFEDMEVGDCLSIEADNFATPKEHWRVASSARYHGLRLGFKFTVRMGDEGVRIWRVA